MLDNLEYSANPTYPGVIFSSTTPQRDTFGFVWG